MATIKTVSEGRRGCGVRKPGGLYLRSDGAGVACGMLPIELTTCPCCGAGVEFSRTPQQIQAKLIQGPCSFGDACRNCGPKRLDPEATMGLIWIGQKFYPDPESFTREADQMGISRRIMHIPEWLVLGETWICLAMKALPTGRYVKKLDNKGEVILNGHNEPVLVPELGRMIFRIFRPTRVEYVVKGDETEEELDAMEKRGITLVRVVNPTEELFEEE